MKPDNKTWEEEARKRFWNGFPLNTNKFSLEETDRADEYMENFIAEELANREKEILDKLIKEFGGHSTPEEMSTDYSRAMDYVFTRLLEIRGIDPIKDEKYIDDIINSKVIQKFLAETDEN